MLGHRHERGDTIIEVMFAFVLFSMVIVGAFMIMNQGMALAQRSLEVTQVRQQIDSQVLLIRTAQQAVNQQLWETIKGKVGTTTPITLSELAESNCRGSMRPRASRSSVSSSRPTRATSPNRRPIAR